MKYSVLFTLLLLTFVACKKNQEFTKPLVENITESVYASGTIKSNNQYQVFSALPGLVKQVFVTEGSLVKKGDLLFSIENETSQLSAENARLQYNYYSMNANVEKVNQQKINIELAKVKMDNESVLLERQRNLFSQEIGTKNELDQRELNFKNASFLYNSALLKLEELKKQLKFAEDQSKKNLEISTTLSGDRLIKSTINGKVYSVLKSKGEMINSQTSIAVIGEADNFYLEMQVDEYDITRLVNGQKIALSMDSYKGQVFEAVVRKINPLMNERSRSFMVEADFIRQPPTLYPNLTVEANIIIQSKEKVLTIPRNYLTEDSFVWISEKEKKKVVTGLKDYQKVEIISGIAAGDIIYKPIK